MFVSITQVRKGDVILEGRDRTEVKKIEHNACSSFGTHINDRECWDRHTRVQIKPATHAESKHFEESGLGDLQADYDDHVIFRV